MCAGKFQLVSTGAKHRVNDVQTRDIMVRFMRRTNQSNSNMRQSLIILMEMVSRVEQDVVPPLWW